MGVCFPLENKGKGEGGGGGLGWGPAKEPASQCARFCQNHPLLGGRFGHFLFFLLGEGEVGVRSASRGGGDVVLRIPGGGVSQVCGGGGGRVFAGNWGGGAKYFFRGRNPHQV